MPLYSWMDDSETEYEYENYCHFVKRESACSLAEESRTPVCQIVSSSPASMKQNCLRNDCFVLTAHNWQIEKEYSSHASANL